MLLTRGWQSVRIARAFWSDTQLVCRDVDGEIESMADDALSNLRAVESQMESDEADIAIANYWERRAMLMSRLDPLMNSFGASTPSHGLPG